MSKVSSLAYYVAALLTFAFIALLLVATVSNEIDRRVCNDASSQQWVELHCDEVPTAIKSEA